MSQPSVTIVGGGLIGLTTALVLAQRGATVTVVDRGALGGGAARGNAGFVCTALVAPLPAPGAVRTAARSLLDPVGAVRVAPAEIPRLASWMAGFARASTASRFHRGQEALGRLNARTPAQFDDLARSGIDVERSGGLIVAVRDRAFAERFRSELEPMRAYGAMVPPAVADGDALRALAPALTGFVGAGFVLDNDRAIDPRRYVDSLIARLGELGVELLPDREITGIDHRNGRVRSVVTDHGPLPTDALVLSAGAGIRTIGRMLGVDLPIIHGQGYNVVVPNHAGLTRPVIFEEAHAVATPLSDGIRIGGTMQLGRTKPAFDERRVDAIIRALRPYVDVDWDQRHDTWAGSRPLSPDGLPLIGAPRQFANVVVAAGHGMYGLTLAPVTAEVVADLVVDGRTALDVSAFDPNRFRL